MNFARYVQFGAFKVLSVTADNAIFTMRNIARKFEIERAIKIITTKSVGHKGQGEEEGKEDCNV